MAAAVERLRPGRTMLVIAHRAELIERADRVVRLAGARTGTRAGAAGGMIAELRSLGALAPVPRARAAGAVVLGAATILCGVGLMATAGYLIARAARAARDPLADGGDRRRPLLRPDAPARPLLRAARDA